MERLAELAEHVRGRIEGNPDTAIQGVAPLDRATAAEIGFLASRNHEAQLASTQAGAVILREELLPHCPTAALVVDDPYLAFARIAQRLYPRPPVVGGVHPQAIVAPEAHIDETAWVGPGSVIEAGVEIGARAMIGPGCVVGTGSRIGPDCRLVARVTVLAAELGRRVLVQPGAIIGGEGFGFARDGEEWVHIPQVGGVRIGDDVEIGANSTIDRGALADTVIDDGVKLDNLIQIGHNCHVGKHTIMAGMSGVAGSTRIGRKCMIGGGVTINGHIQIADGVVVTGDSMITRSITESGLYSSGTGLQPNREWRKSVARFRELDGMARRLRKLEERLSQEAADSPGDATGISAETRKLARTGRAPKQTKG